jgi:hypothetical protein
MDQIHTHTHSLSHLLVFLLLIDTTPHLSLLIVPPLLLYRSLVLSFLFAFRFDAGRSRAGRDSVRGACAPPPLCFPRRFSLFSHALVGASLFPLARFSPFSHALVGAPSSALAVLAHFSLFFHALYRFSLRSSGLGLLPVLPRLVRLWGGFSFTLLGARHSPRFLTFGSPEGGVLPLISS